MKRIKKMNHELSHNDSYPDRLHWNWMLKNYVDDSLPELAIQRAQKQGWSMNLEDLFEEESGEKTNEGIENQQETDQTKYSGDGKWGAGI